MLFGSLLISWKVVKIRKNHMDTKSGAITSLALFLAFGAFLFNFWEVKLSFCSKTNFSTGLEFLRLLLFLLCHNDHHRLRWHDAKYFRSVDKIYPKMTLLNIHMTFTYASLFENQLLIYLWNFRICKNFRILPKFQNLAQTSACLTNALPSFWSLFVVLITLDFRE